MKLCVRAGLVYLGVNGGHFLGAMGWFSGPNRDYTTTSSEKPKSQGLCLLLQLKNLIFF